MYIDINNRKLMNEILVKADTAVRYTQLGLPLLHHIIEDVVVGTEYNQDLFTFDVEVKCRKTLSSLGLGHLSYKWKELWVLICMMSPVVINAGPEAIANLMRAVTIEKKSSVLDNKYYKDIVSKLHLKKGGQLTMVRRVKNSICESGYSMLVTPGVTLPRITITCEEYKTLVLGNDKLDKNESCWMSITQNEIETMQEDIDNASGKVLTCGLGLGYYTYMVACKSNVESVTVVERNQTVIDIFKEQIMPVMDEEVSKKIEIIKADAIDFLSTEDLNAYNTIFIDIWKDMADLDSLFACKHAVINRGKLSAHVSYWIESEFFNFINAERIAEMEETVYNQTKDSSIYDMPDMMFSPFKRKIVKLVHEIEKDTRLVHAGDVEKLLTDKTILDKMALLW